ncbi:hypothetical protein EVAR_75479_1 [Eumeta japonica]|uniref:Uncharacterized protein n=1 Tax=Eumeta variegata TaxID=151549 RepID=A0A4C1TK72_EUMVA|nr:hypothetical protein EVAR_75479_1 [Eumeta japonica]
MGQGFDRRETRARSIPTSTAAEKRGCVEATFSDRQRGLPTVQCPNADDLCYSQHTPFGVVNRGCYNMNSNVNVFVCSCNLCNYISFTEMPYIFSNHQEWAKNVEELSRMIHFRKSIYKRMSCLSCYVNTTNTEQIDNDDNAYCLDGNVIKVPSTECPQDEICGVKSRRGTGYIWRGCLKTPLYNYWYALCDSDDCNNDQIVSLLNM